MNIADTYMEELRNKYRDMTVGGGAAGATAAIADSDAAGGGGGGCRAAGKSDEACITALPAAGGGADAAGGAATCWVSDNPAAERAAPAEEGSARVKPGRVSRTGASNLTRATQEGANLPCSPPWSQTRRRSMSKALFDHRSHSV